MTGVIASNRPAFRAIAENRNVIFLPLPDSKRKPICFLVHDLGLERCFWAVWPDRQSFDTYSFPQAYGVEENTPSAIRKRLCIEYIAPVELELSDQAKTGIYRRIRRAELPKHMQDKIQETLNLKHSHFSEKYQQIGFEEADLNDVALLKKRYRQLATQHHPDQGGELSRFLVLQDIYHQILRKMPRNADPDKL